MYTDIPLWVSITFVVVGLAALAWSSDAFVDGASTVAKALGISPFIIGMVIIGFGTSAPELCVSVMSGLSGHSNLSLGNAYGSSIFNIAVILGVAALISPSVVKPSISFVAAPVLALITGFSMFVLRDGFCSRVEALILLGAFLVILPGYCWFDQKFGSAQKDESSTAANKNVVVAVLKLVVGLAVLMGSSHILVWGSVDLARAMGVSELLIGLTIVSIGTSLPELASAVVSARRGEHEFVLGNIVGSNLFNTLAVVGLAGSVCPIGNFSPYVLSRDLPLMLGLSISITIMGTNWKHLKENGVVARTEGAIWVFVFIAYTALMICQEMQPK